MHWRKRDYKVFCGFLNLLGQIPSKHIGQFKYLCGKKVSFVKGLKLQAEVAGICNSETFEAKFVQLLQKSGKSIVQILEHLMDVYKFTVDEIKAESQEIKQVISEQMLETQGRILGPSKFEQFISGIQLMKSQGQFSIQLDKIKLEAVFHGVKFLETQEIEISGNKKGLRQNIRYINYICRAVFLKSDSGISQEEDINSKNKGKPVFEQAGITINQMILNKKNWTGEKKKMKDKQKPPVKQKSNSNLQKYGVWSLYSDDNQNAKALFQNTMASPLNMIISTRNQMTSKSIFCETGGQKQSISEKDMDNLRSVLKLLKQPIKEPMKEEKQLIRQQICGEPIQIENFELENMQMNEKHTLFQKKRESSEKFTNSKAKKELSSQTFSPIQLIYQSGESELQQKLHPLHLQTVPLQKPTPQQEFEPISQQQFEQDYQIKSQLQLSEKQDSKNQWKGYNSSEQIVEESKDGSNLDQPQKIQSQSKRHEQENQSSENDIILEHFKMGLSEDLLKRVGFLLSYKIKEFSLLRESHKKALEAQSMYEQGPWVYSEIVRFASSIIINFHTLSKRSETVINIMQIVSDFVKTRSGPQCAYFYNNYLKKLKHPKTILSQIRKKYKLQNEDLKTEVDRQLKKFEEDSLKWCFLPNVDHQDVPYISRSLVSDVEKESSLPDEKAVRNLFLASPILIDQSQLLNPQLLNQERFQVIYVRKIKG